MLRFYDENDTLDDNFRDYIPQLSENSRIYYDYNGCLPQYEDAADHYKLNRRLFNAVL